METDDRFHQSRPQEINDIASIKTKLEKRLEVFPVFAFLQLFGQKDYPGQFRNVEKGLILLYMMISGSSLRSMDNFIPYGSLQKISKEFWQGQQDEIEKWVTKHLNHSFSSADIRLLVAHKQH